MLKLYFQLCFYLQQTNFMAHSIWHLLCAQLMHFPSALLWFPRARPLWTILMAAINLWVQPQPQSIPPTWAQWSRPLSGLHPRKFHYHNINTSRCQELAGVLFTLYSAAFLFLWSHWMLSPLRQVSRGPEQSGQKCPMNFTWVSSGPRISELGAGPIMFTLNGKHILCYIHI